MIFFFIDWSVFFLLLVNCCLLMNWFVCLSFSGASDKVILVEGHFVSYLPLCSRNEPVLIARCTPVAMPETRECVVQGATNIFTTVHNMDMKFASIDARYATLIPPALHYSAYSAIFRIRMDVFFPFSLKLGFIVLPPPRPQAMLSLGILASLS